MFNETGDPFGVDRIGIALEPEADYKLRADGSGGCGGPRVTFRASPTLRHDLHAERPTDRTGNIRRLVPLATPGVTYVPAV